MSVRQTWFFNVHISDDLTRTYNITQLVKKAQPWLQFLSRLRICSMTPKTLSSFYSCIIHDMLVYHCVLLEEQHHRLQTPAVRGKDFWEDSQVAPTISVGHHRVHRSACSIIKDSTTSPNTAFSHFCPLAGGTAVWNAGPQGSGTAFILRASHWSTDSIHCPRPHPHPSLHTRGFTLAHSRTCAHTHTQLTLHSHRHLLCLDRILHRYVITYLCILYIVVYSVVHILSLLIFFLF